MGRKPSTTAHSRRRMSAFQEDVQHHDGMTDERDAIAERLAAFAAQLQTQLGDAATVTTDSDDGPWGTAITITPMREGALAVTWNDFGDGLSLTAGHNGGWWEQIDRDDEGVRFIEDMVRSVIAGQVVEVFGLRRSTVRVTMADGEVVEETGHSFPLGILPSPGWRRRGRQVRYAPYR